jgi:hypothetical protein
MGFASSWLEAGCLFPELIREAPDGKLGIIVVVPVFDETEITVLLDSLLNCSEPGCAAEVIIVVNAPASAGERSLLNNIKTINDIESWKERNAKPFFRLFALNLGQPFIKGWGVGLARKAGMDEALRRFNTINNPEGVIVNLDADCQVRANYFLAIEDDILKKKDINGCSIYYEHPLEGKEFQSEIYKAVAQYELHLRYYYQALKFTGFPYVVHTIGSAIAVKARTYAAAGGMNRRQAGEDFYFIQKLIPTGGYFNLYSTTVFPSPRISDRVPFGTGPVVGKMIGNRDYQFLTYNPLAFSELKTFFRLIDKLYYSDNRELSKIYHELPCSLLYFISKDEWLIRIGQVKANTASLKTFRKRFFGWFNMFKVVKYLNLVHIKMFEKVPVESAAVQILKMAGYIDVPDTTIDLINNFRKIERNS